MHLYLHILEGWRAHPPTNKLEIPIRKLYTDPPVVHPFIDEVLVYDLGGRAARLVHVRGRMEYFRAVMRGEMTMKAFMAKAPMGGSMLSQNTRGKKRAVDGGSSVENSVGGKWTEWKKLMDSGVDDEQDEQEDDEDEEDEEAESDEEWTPGNS